MAQPSAGNPAVTEITISLRDGQRLPVSLTLAGGPSNAEGREAAAGQAGRARKQSTLPDTLRTPAAAPTSCLRLCTPGARHPPIALFSPPVCAVQFLLRSSGGDGDGASGPAGLPGLSAHIMAFSRGINGDGPPGPPSAAGAAGGGPTGGEHPTINPLFRLPPAPRLSSSAPEAAPGGDPTEPSFDRIQRLSTAVAGSIFSDLISGALRPGDVGPPPASEVAITKLERNVRCPAGTSCSICLCELAAADDGATRMPCGHCYHDGCISKWLRSHNTCPVCRAQVEADETPRAPSSLAALLQGWRSRTEAADGPAGPAGAFFGGLGASAPLLSSSAPSSAAPPSGLPASIAARARDAARNAALRAEPPPADADLERLSVAELKRRLTQLNVDFRGVLEKRQLIELLRNHTRPPPPRLHVQLHMEVVPLPPGMSGRQALEAAARQATQSAMQQRSADVDVATHRASTTAATSTLDLPSPLAPPATTTADSEAAAHDASVLLAPSRRRRREHVPGEFKEPSTRRARRE